MNKEAGNNQTLTGASAPMRCAVCHTYNVMRHTIALSERVPIGSVILWPSPYGPLGLCVEDAHYYATNTPRTWEELERKNRETGGLFFDPEHMKGDKNKRVGEPLVCADGEIVSGINPFRMPGTPSALAAVVTGAMMPPRGLRVYTLYAMDITGGVHAVGNVGAHRTRADALGAQAACAALTEQRGRLTNPTQVS